jgi:hypothetical protein
VSLTCAFFVQVGSVVGVVVGLQILRENLTNDYPGTLVPTLIPPIIQAVAVVLLDVVRLLWSHQTACVDVLIGSATASCIERLRYG